MMRGLVWVYALSLIGSLLGWSWLGSQLLGQETAWKRCYPWVLALSTPWLMTAKFVWSETSFLLLFTAYAVGLYSYLTTKRKGWLLAATAAGMLLPLQRTAGFFVLFGVALGLVVAYRRTLRAYALALALHFLLSVSGGLLWQVRVWRTGLDLPLVLSNPATAGGQAMSDFGFMLVHWLLPLPVPTAPITWGYLAGGALVVAILVVGAAEIGKFGQVLLITAGVYVVLHALSYQLSRGSAGFHDSERYAAVFFGPVMLLLFGALRRTLGNHPRLLHVLLLIWLLYPAARMIHNAVFLRSRPTPHFTTAMGSADQIGNAAQ
ncbi:hypothetical protein [Hymenobacter telluris]|nr:hypothetical protein [Hymenobacter telluris]